ncbi:hypothetical protein JHK82_048088 [Glycine max]|uniref:Uncharacterized protein n=2 Tax=Glycine subgen. Soja TaxID=1462606 RepID=K7MMI6_SOYBN|nr:hypothetical protein JHK86_047964 [Glycine max]KAG4933758.1 hypothetical protein JHK87_047760 [Glycine soja]KAG4943926.1 hypothetical protein JHK85_048572 [Glycine max]KAG5098234.1 hypothetical protein JHK82_048088 [Glycine max]KAG5103020.1 hypothetical protein JHK84_047989 [Glycine max]
MPNSESLPFCGILSSSLVYLLLTRAILCSPYEVVPEAVFCPFSSPSIRVVFKIQLMLLFLPVGGCYSSLVSNSLLASKLAINQPVEWKQQLNQRFCCMHLLNLHLFHGSYPSLAGNCFQPIIS